VGTLGNKTFEFRERLRVERRTYVNPELSLSLKNISIYNTCGAYLPYIIMAFNPQLLHNS
jgi:hypothetical protein|tara:strand:+ start:1199 stop:1378 length:180 start_codon:yes stop_codon:yes gene_type:complete